MAGVADTGIGTETTSMIAMIVMRIAVMIEEEDLSGQVRSFDIFGTF